MTAEEVLDERGRGEPGPQPRTDDDRVVLVVQDPGQGVIWFELLHVVLGQAHGRGLHDLRGEQRLE